MMIIVALLLISVIVSTPETRAAGAERVKPWGRYAAVAALILWILILL